MNNDTEVDVIQEKSNKEGDPGVDKFKKVFE